MSPTDKRLAVLQKYMCVAPAPKLTQPGLSDDQFEIEEVPKATETYSKIAKGCFQINQCIKLSFDLLI